jgi:hypothetical protein
LHILFLHKCFTKKLLQNNLTVSRQFNVSHKGAKPTKLFSLWALCLCGISFIYLCKSKRRSTFVETQCIASVRHSS